MTATTASYQSVSPWWRFGVLIAMIVGFSVLIGMTVSAYQVAPPIPDKIVGTDGATLYNGNDIRAGQEVFLKYGLMENGPIGGHGAYLGPDFAAEYLHTLGLEAEAAIASQLYGKPPDALAPAERSAVDAEAANLLKQNHYDPSNHTFGFSDIAAASFTTQIATWHDDSSKPTTTS